MVSVITDCLRERGFGSVASEAGLPSDDRMASDFMLNTQVPQLRNRPFLVEGLNDYDFKTLPSAEPLNFVSEHVFDLNVSTGNLYM